MSGEDDAECVRAAIETAVAGIDDHEVDVAAAEPRLEAVVTVEAAHLGDDGVAGERDAQSAEGRRGQQGDDVHGDRDRYDAARRCPVRAR